MSDKDVYWSMNRFCNHINNREEYGKLIKLPNAELEKLDVDVSSPSLPRAQYITVGLVRTILAYRALLNRAIQYEAAKIRRRTSKP